MSSNKKYTYGLIILTIIYFVIEIVINFSIYRQLSVSSDVFIAESMELWGKIITGLGLGLLATRYALNKYGKNTLITFLACCVITIPMSFGLQNLLINYVVNSATDEDKNKAMLVVATHGTLVPFYNTNHWTKELKWTTKNSFIYPFGRIGSHKYANYWENRERELILVSGCAQKTSNSMGIVKGTDKAFFPYVSLLKNIDESAYKQAVIDYYMCAFENEKYFEEHTRSTLNQTEAIVLMFLKFYVPANNKYDSYKNHTDNLKEAKKIADERWRSAMDGFFGHKTTITPDLEDLNFTNHPDVKRWYIEKTGIKDLYPGDKDFHEELTRRIEKDLPYSVIPAYKSTTGEPSAQYLELTSDEVDEQGKKAYKAVIMPFIAMGFSAFFLLLNIILIVNFYIEKTIYSALGRNKLLDNAFTGEIRRVLSPDMYTRLGNFCLKIGFNYEQMGTLSRFYYQPWHSVKRFTKLKGFFVFVMAWFLFWPTFKNSGPYEELNNSNFKNSAKWVYYHENNLIYIWDKFSNKLQSMNEEIEAQENLLKKKQHDTSVMYDLYDDVYMGEPISKEDAQKIRDEMAISREEQQLILRDRINTDTFDIGNLSTPTYRGELMTKEQVIEVKKKIESKRLEYADEL